MFIKDLQGTVIKSKNYEWMNIPFFKDIINDIKQRKNISILDDQKKWTPTQSINTCDFAISLYSSLSDEMLAIGKPVIIVNKFGIFGKWFSINLAMWV